MPRNKKILDETRVRILSELFTPGALKPNFALIQQKTGLSRPTIAASIQFLLGKNAVVSFQPSLNWRAMGLKIEVLELANLDLSQKATLDRLVEMTRQDVHCRLFSSLVSGDYNFAFRDMYRTVEDFHAGLNSHYYSRLPALYDLVRKHSYYYFSDPVFKHHLISRSVAKLLLSHPSPEGKAMQHDDGLRLRVLDALYEPGALRPNLYFMRRKTGLHLNTLSSSLQYLEKEGIIFEYIPRINRLMYGLNLLGYVLLQLPTNTPYFERLVEHVKQDPHVLVFSSLISGEYNLVLEFLNRDIDEFNQVLQGYYQLFPELLTAKKDIIYVTPPIYKNNSRSFTALSIVKKELGF